MSLNKSQLPQSFGVFTPTGHLVLGFATDPDMRAAEQDLLDRGFETSSIHAFTSTEVVAEIERMKADFRVVANLLANESDLMDRHLAVAQEGGGFLVIYAPEEADASRVMDVARHHNLRVAHKYNRLTLELVA